MAPWSLEVLGSPLVLHSQGPPLDEANLSKYLEMRHRVFLEQQEFDSVQRQKVQCVASRNRLSQGALPHVSLCLGVCVCVCVCVCQARENNVFLKYNPAIKAQVEVRANELAACSGAEILHGTPPSSCSNS
jgi:hypothetical protein